ncbi:MAG: hypothetical protein O4861_05300 [Trichodesmium sp. St16_bin4-tuft]|nr:hypothetical protein [Trichodesmium sp. St5_bin8]MDE5079315.1 hypothetical protein [Trichodesmium sp. St2_bin6]MDE5097782.1 hypothetical protein [Trichodesmium sp. St16_bin4-tuft]MDE5105148.1 hypothetical protein [Trichodesmium sp. St19_bin2]
MSIINSVEHLQNQSPGAKIVLIWDGTSYHHFQEFRDFLDIVNS